VVETGVVGEDPERIEIELTSDDGGRADSPFARRGDESRIDSSPVERDDRRLLAVGLLVGSLGLLFGWVLGRSGTDETAVPVAAVTTVLAASDPVRPIDSVTGEPDDRGSGSDEESSATSATDGREQPAANVAFVTKTKVAFASELDGQPLEIVAFGNGRQLSRLDLQTGLLTTLRATQLQPFGRPRLVIGDDWVLFPTSDPDLPSSIVIGDGQVKSIDFGPSWEVAGTTDGEGIWLLSAELADGGPGVARLATIEGERIAEIALPGVPSLFDPAGGFVVDAPGGWFRVTGDGAERITGGALLAIGRDVAVTHECDDTLRCAVVVIDRDTAQRRPLDLDLPLGDAGLSAVAPVGAESVSPDGSAAFVEVVNPAGGGTGQPTLGLLDLTSGAVVEVGPAQDIDQTVWTPDGRFVLYVKGGKIVAHDRTSGDEVDVAAELIAVDAFGVRRTQPPVGAP
jgi:hypothetical protein